MTIHSASQPRVHDRHRTKPPSHVIMYECVYIYIYEFCVDGFGDIAPHVKLRVHASYTTYM